MPEPAFDARFGQAPSHKLHRVTKLLLMLGAISIIQRLVMVPFAKPFSIAWRAPNIVNDLYLALAFMGLMSITRRRLWVIPCVAMVMCALVEATYIVRIWQAATAHDAMTTGGRYLQSVKWRLVCFGLAETITGVCLVVLRTVLVSRLARLAGLLLIPTGLHSAHVGTLWLFGWRADILLGSVRLVADGGEIVGLVLLAILFFLPSPYAAWQAEKAMHVL
jgi:hypothetical protein